MAFDFLGTLSLEQFQLFRSFLEAQIVDIDEEINFLYVELNNLQQTLSFFSKADEYFGGNTSSILYPTELNIKKVVAKQDDSTSASLMEQVKKPFISTIKYKRERLEFKMKKLYDAIEQAQEMIDRKSIAKSKTKALLGELERKFISSNFNFLFNSEEERLNFLQGVLPSNKQVQA